MADALTVDLKSEEFCHGVQQGFWRLCARDGAILTVEFTAPDGRVYQMRLDCDSYGIQPIGGRFINEQTGQPTAASWPRGNDVFAGWVKFAGELFICWDQDRFGIQRHPEWSERKAWINATPNQLVSYMTFIARLLNTEAMGYERDSMVRG